MERKSASFYKQTKVRQTKSVDEMLILALVRREREMMPRLGSRKLLVRIRPHLEDAHVKIGRDKFIKLLKRNNLLVPKIKAFTPKTTKFDCSLKVARNLIAEIVVRHVNQVWVADITYIRLNGGFIYLCLIMDKYSRKIIGWHAGDSLETSGVLKALDMALKTLRTADPKPIHHSDRGCQYASHLYREKLEAAGLLCSMTEELHCYENAHAERLNGILKYEFGLGCTFKNMEQACKAIRQAIDVYNLCRPHENLDYKTPQEVYGAA